MENASNSRALKLDKRQSKKRRSDKMKLRISRASEAALSLYGGAFMDAPAPSERASEAYQGIKLCAATAAREGRKEGRRDRPTLRSKRVQFSMHPPPPPVKKGRPFLRSTKRATCPPPSLRTAAAIRNHATPKVANLPTFPLAGNIASSGAGDVP